MRRYAMLGILLLPLLLGGCAQAYLKPWLDGWIGEDWEDFANHPQHRQFRCNRQGGNTVRCQRGSRVIVWQIDRNDVIQGYRTFLQ